MDDRADANVVVNAYTSARGGVSRLVIFSTSRSCSLRSTGSST